MQNKILNISSTSRYREGSESKVEVIFMGTSAYEKCLKTCKWYQTKTMHLLPHINMDAGISLGEIFSKFFCQNDHRSWMNLLKDHKSNCWASISKISFNIERPYGILMTHCLHDYTAPKEELCDVRPYCSLFSARVSGSFSGSYENFLTSTKQDCFCLIDMKQNNPCRCTFLQSESAL